MKAPPRRGRPPKRRADRMITLVVTVTPELKKQLEVAARAEETTVSELVRTVLGSFNGEF